MTNLDRGVIISAVGDSYIKEAIHSAQRVRKLCPDLPITLYANKPKLVGKHSKLFHQIHPIDISPIKNQGYKYAAYAKICKLRAMASFPYKTTLYLDTDTKVVSPIYELFEGKFDISLANSPKLDKSKIPYRLVSYKRLGAYNSGVVIYRQNEKTNILFKRWIKMCLKDPARLKKSKTKFYDQPKLVKLLNNKPPLVTIKVIPNTIYNARHTMFKKLKKDKLWSKVKIFHSHQKI